MLQNSKIIKSRNEWKEKATLRATENQNYRKTIGRNKVKNQKSKVKTKVKNQNSKVKNENQNSKIKAAKPLR